MGDNINIYGFAAEKEPLWQHTTFAVGGPADFYAEPRDLEDLRQLFQWAAEKKLTPFILGGGSNLLVADKGIRGLVINTRNFQQLEFKENVLVAGAGGDISRTAWETGAGGWGGLDFLFGMPGSVGGALWMNARCYGEEVGEKFLWADVMQPDGRVIRRERGEGIWDYKISPFQGSGDIILQAAFAMTPGDPETLKTAMREKRDDRLNKGHYRAPCAGSAFKNDRSFGEPSGKIIHDCGLKGLRVGGARVSPWHGNIIVNDAGASARDIRDLMVLVQTRVKEKTGFLLEPEVLLAGEEEAWPKI